MQVRQDTQLAMTFPFVVFCHYSEQFYVSQAEQFSDGLCGQKQYYMPESHEKSYDLIVAPAFFCPKWISSRYKSLLPINR